MATTNNTDYKSENDRLRAAAWKLLDECYSGRCYRKPSVETVEALRDVLTGRDIMLSFAPEAAK